MDDRFTYILTFDRNDQLDYKVLHDKLVSLDCIKNWFHYIKSSYILISDKVTANALDREIGSLFKDNNYLILGVDLKDSQGWLPKRAWEWIESQSK